VFDASYLIAKEINAAQRKPHQPNMTLDDSANPSPPPSRQPDSRPPSLDYGLITSAIGNGRTNPPSTPMA
jgi:hypothetical protein